MCNENKLTNPLGGNFFFVLVRYIAYVDPHDMDMKIIYGFGGVS